MSILDRIRRLFGSEDIPEAAEEIYRMSRSEAEALDKLEAERSRSDRHREVLIGDVKVLAEEEERLLSDGSRETSSVKKRILAKRVAEIRGRVDEGMNRIDLLTRRMALFGRQIALVRDRAVLSEPLPEREEIEKAAEDALVARQEMEERAELSDLFGDVTRIAGTPEGEREALADLDGRGEEDLSFLDMVRQEERRSNRSDSDRQGDDDRGREALAE